MSVKKRGLGDARCPNPICMHFFKLFPRRKKIQYDCGAISPQILDERLQAFNDCSLTATIHCAVNIQRHEVVTCLEVNSLVRPSE